RYVIEHEWSHWFLSTFGRSDSVEGPHGDANDKLDPRVAFDEGFANAHTGMIEKLHLGFGLDTFGLSQTQVGGVNLESPAGTVRGFFNESSIIALIFDLFDPKFVERDRVFFAQEPPIEMVDDVEL